MSNIPSILKKPSATPIFFNFFNEHAQSLTMSLFHPLVFFLSFTNNNIDGQFKSQFSTYTHVIYERVFCPIHKTASTHVIPSHFRHSIIEVVTTRSSRIGITGQPTCANLSFGFLLCPSCIAIAIATCHCFQLERVTHWHYCSETLGSNQREC